MLEETPLHELETFLSLNESEHSTTPAIITNDDSNEWQTMVTRVIEQGKNAFSQQTPYSKLVDKESQPRDSARQQISSDGNVLLNKKEYGTCLRYIFLKVLAFILIFSLGFLLCQIFAGQSIIPSSIQSKYESVWSNSTSKFALMNTSNSPYYYSAFEIRVIMSSNYSFSSESNIDTYGYIYENIFHPDAPSLNLLTKSRTSSEDGNLN